MNALHQIFAVATLGLLALDAAASAQTRAITVMIAGEDISNGSIPRSNVNFSRVQRAIAERLRAGFTVYEEIDVVPDLPSARIERPLPKLLENARLAKTPVDVIVVIQLYGSVSPVPKIRDTFQESIRIEARWLRARDGEYLGNYTFGRGVQLPLIEGECAKTRECLLKRFGDGAEMVGTAMGDELATKLEADLRGNLNPNAPPMPSVEGAPTAPR